MTSICPFSISTCLRSSLYSALLAGLIFGHAQAAQPIFYHIVKSWKEQRILDDMQGRFDSLQSTNFERALIDLNGDGVDEYILREPGKSGILPHYIYALRRGKPIFLGQIDGHKVVPTDEKTYGVRDFLVYNIPNNDFKAVTYKWNPYNFQYVEVN